MPSRKPTKSKPAPTKPGTKPPLQWLLYLHAAHPSIKSDLLNATLFEPSPGKEVETQIDPLAKPLPYKTVFDAILDGWRVVHFPYQREWIEDREIDVVGYEFILEKIQPVG